MHQSIHLANLDKFNILFHNECLNPFCAPNLQDIDTNESLAAKTF